MLNRVILIGRLAADPELRYTPSGAAVATFAIAVSRVPSADAKAQGQPEEADFIDLVCWRQTAEFAANYLSKGRLVAVEGKLQIRRYVTKDGQQRKAAEVIVDSLKSLERPKEPTADLETPSEAATAPRPPAARTPDLPPAHRPDPPRPAPARSAATMAPDPFDDTDTAGDPFAE